MSHKFFSLIHEGRIHIGPNTKRIPAKDFSSLLSSKELIEEAKSDVTQYRKEVDAECEGLREQAKKEGFEAGFSEWAEKVAEIEQEIVKVRADLEELVIPVALKAAKKIVHRELKSSKEIIVDIVSQSLKSVAQHKKIVIYVSKDDIRSVEKSKGQLTKLFETLESLSIVERADIESGGCVIETEGGIINAQLDNQWMLLENAFQKLLKPTLAKKSETS